MELLFLDFGYPFLLIFSRVSAFVALFPPFAWRGIPAMVRVFFTLVLAFLLAFSWEGQLSIPAGGLAFTLALARELAAGFVLGFFVYLFLSIFLIAGQFMDHKAGLMLGGAFDPLFGSQVTLIGQFLYFFAVVLFLSFNGHHLLFLALQNSLQVIPLAGPWFSLSLPAYFFELFARVFLLAFQIAAPVIVVLLIMDVALGLLSRTVPQIHVFIVGLPLKIALVLGLLLLMLPSLERMAGHIFQVMGRDIALLMEAW